VKSVVYNDVLAAVAYVASHPKDARETALSSLFEQVRQAEAYTERYHCAHPVFGDGTLVSAALRHGKRGDTSFYSEAGLEAWLLVLTGLRDQMRQPDAQLMQRVTVGSNSSRLR
jgi:hypothetical protein